MYYGYTANQLIGVTQSYALIENLKAVYPYIKFRKFQDEEAAWFFARTNHTEKPLLNLKMYGDKLLKKHYVIVSYVVTDDIIYCTINTSKIGTVRIYSEDENISVDNRVSSILIQIKGLRLCNDSIYSHVIALYRILTLIGPFIDIELIIPDHSIYYMLTSYSGTNNNINRLHILIKERLGNIAYTLKEW